MKKSRAISEFLVALARQVETLSDEEIDHLVNKAGLPEMFRRSAAASSTKRPEHMEARAQAEKLMRELASQSSRQAAAEFLSTLAPTRAVLIYAAKMREVHINRQDTVGTISEKLVENVVGSRLDSARIRGT